MRSPLAWPCAWALALPGRGSWSRCGDLWVRLPSGTVVPTGFAVPTAWGRRGGSRGCVADLIPLWASLSWPAEKILEGKLVSSLLVALGRWCRCGLGHSCGGAADLGWHGHRKGHRAHTLLGSGGGHPVLAASQHVCTLTWPPDPSRPGPPF